MIDFEVDWNRWFDGIEQPNQDTLDRARRDSKNCLVEAGRIHVEDDDGTRALSDLTGAIDEALGSMNDAQEEVTARFKDAEFAAEQMMTGMAWFLNHHKAVLVTNARTKHDPIEVRPLEVVSWIENNCRGDYQAFDVENHVAIVFLDDADRLHCKLRFG